jgi:hypothetical protein
MDFCNVSEKVTVKPSMVVQYYNDNTQKAETRESEV